MRLLKHLRQPHLGRTWKKPTYSCVSPNPYIGRLVKAVYNIKKY